jgi:hypothetical protein
MAPTQESILAIVFEALTNLNSERDAANQVPLDIDTVLFGGTSLLDSLALVSVISDVEMAVSDAVGEPISLTDDKALSEPVSPFTDVRTLCAYVLQLTGGKV